MSRTVEIIDGPKFTNTKHSTLVRAEGKPGWGYWVSTVLLAARANEASLPNAGRRYEVMIFPVQTRTEVVTDEDGKPRFKVAPTCSTETQRRELSPFNRQSLTSRTAGRHYQQAVSAVTNYIQQGR